MLRDSVRNSQSARLHHGRPLSEVVAAFPSTIRTTRAPCWTCDILDLVTEGNQCFGRMRFSGTHRGDFFAFKPTGKNVEWAGAALFTFKDGLVMDLWVLGDVHGLLQLLERNRE